jgi:thioredoxin-like negative regulator of GroEL
MFLTPDDFTNDDGVIRVNPRCTMVVLFHSHECDFSRKFFSLFKESQREVVGLVFASINVSLHPQVVHVMKHSNLELTYVPLMVVFQNGRVFSIYKGAIEYDNIKEFILSVPPLSFC